MENLEKIAKYRTIIKEILEHYASYKPSHGEIEMSFYRIQNTITIKY